MDEYQSLNIRSGTANITWCSFRSVVDEYCTCNSGSIWARCSNSWQHKRSAESMKGIS